MNEISFASLSPSLLARKGGARPAMRPQHGGMLGAIGGASEDGNSSAEETLDDLGWNDMGDEDAPRHDADILQLTPSPVNEQTAAEARELDEQAGAKLAESAVPQSPARDQQNVLAQRIGTKSPPILSDAIMSDDDFSDEDDFEDSDYDESNFTGPEFEETARFEEANPEEAAFDAPAVEEFVPHTVTSDVVTGEAVADEAVAAEEVPVAPPIVLPTVTATKTPRPAARAHRVPATEQGKRAAFTLRLDPERHLKLRLASTIHGRSAQQIVTDALDAFLGDMPDLESLAAQVQRPTDESGTDNAKNRGPDYEPIRT